MLFVCFIAGYSFPQDTISDKSNMMIEYGIGNNHLIDEYISKNEYTGISNKYGFLWSVLDSSRLTGVDFSYNTISTLQNHNNSATTYDFQLGYKYLYDIYRGTLFSSPFVMYLGPEFNIYMHYRDQKVAASSKALSIASLISTDASLAAISYISDRFFIISNLSLSLLSFTARTPSLKEVNNLPTPIKLLTVLSFQNISSSIMACYTITNNIEINVGYNFRFLLINEWDKFRLIGDHVMLRLGVYF